MPEVRSAATDSDGEQPSRRRRRSGTRGPVRPGPPVRARPRRPRAARADLAGRPHRRGPALGGPVDARPRGVPGPEPARRARPAGRDHPDRRARPEPGRSSPTSPSSSAASASTGMDLARFDRDDLARADDRRAWAARRTPTSSTGRWSGRAATRSSPSRSSPRRARRAPTRSRRACATSCWRASRPSPRPGQEVLRVASAAGRADRRRAARGGLGPAAAGRARGPARGHRSADPRARRPTARTPATCSATRSCGRSSTHRCCPASGRGCTRGMRRRSRPAPGDRADGRPATGPPPTAAELAVSLGGGRRRPARAGRDGRGRVAAERGYAYPRRAPPVPARPRPVGGVPDATAAARSRRRPRPRRRDRGPDRRVRGRRRPRRAGDRAGRPGGRSRPGGAAPRATALVPLGGGRPRRPPRPRSRQPSDSSRTDPPSAARARILAHRAGILMLGGRLAESIPVAEEAIARRPRGRVARRRGAGVSGSSAGTSPCSGASTRASRRVRAGVAIADELGGAEGIALGASNLAILLDRVGRTAEALEVARDGWERVRALGVERTYGGLILAIAAKAAIALGRWDEADEFLRLGLARRPIGTAGIRLRIQRGRLDTFRGDLASAAARARRRRGSADDGGGRDGGSCGPPRRDRRSGRCRGPGDRCPGGGRGGVRARRRRHARSGARDARARPRCVSRRTSPARARTPRRRRPRRGACAGSTRSPARSSGSPTMLGVPPAIATAVTEPTRDRAMAALCRAEVARFDERDEPPDWDAVAAAFDGDRAPVPGGLRPLPVGGGDAPGRGARGRSAAATLAAARATAARLGAAPLLDEIDRLARQARLDLVGGRRRRDRRPPAPAIRPDRARARGAAPHRRRLVEPADRRRPVHQPQDGQRPRVAHLRQARGREPGRRRRDRPAPRHRGRPTAARSPAPGRAPTAPRASARGAARRRSRNGGRSRDRRCRRPRRPAVPGSGWRGRAGRGRS